MKFKTLNVFIISLLGFLVMLSIVSVISFLWPILAVFSYLLFLLIISSTPGFNFFIKAYHKKENEIENRICLTFDDGPSLHTLEILEILKKHKVKACFFCIGRQIEKHPKIFKKILENGHLVGNHSYTHTRKMGFLSSKKITEEINACNQLVKKQSGLEMRLFRPPFGIINPKTKRALENTGHIVMGWSIRPYDAVITAPTYILNKITKTVKPGDVVLLHDHKAQSVEILEQLLLFLEENNLKAVRPDILFNIHAYS